MKRARRLKVYIGEYHVAGNQKLSKDPLKQLPHVDFDLVHISSPLAVGAMWSGIHDGSYIMENVIKIFRQLYRHNLFIESIKKKKDLHKRPRNCDKVIVPKVNKEIWRQMMKQGFTKKRDLRLMNVQSAITKSACAIVSVAESLLKMDGDKHDQEVRNCLDAIYLLGHANTAMSMQRRELLRPVLKSDYAGLCDSGTPVTSLLFGDDLPKSLKEARQVGNVGRDYPSKNGRRYGFHQKPFHQKSQNDYFKKKTHNKKFKKD